MHRPVSEEGGSADDGMEKATDEQNQKAAEYEVGYGRPPKDTRFKPGTCGNPKGRPRALKNLAAVFEAALNERVPVNDNGKRKKITMFEVVVKQAMRKAASGDLRAVRLVLDLWFRLHPEGKQQPYGIELMRKLGAAAADALEKEEAEKEKGEAPSDGE
jgi:hypothetical protein